MGRAEREKELARDIVSMLKASMAALDNTRGSNHPFESYRYNNLAPGIRHSIDLIERAFALKG